LLRRGTIALLVAIGLLLMHGGIGPAFACTGMPGGMTAQPMSHIATHLTTTDANAGGDVAAQQSQHHQPATQLATQLATQPLGGHHGEMCTSTPAGGESGGPSAAPGQVATLTSAQLILDHLQPRPSRATGRHPPNPDLVSVLCVIRQ
jgi:hypothetical protein